MDLIAQNANRCQGSSCRSETILRNSPAQPWHHTRCSTSISPSPTILFASVTDGGTKAAGACCVLISMTSSPSDAMAPGLWWRGCGLRVDWPPLWMTHAHTNSRVLSPRPRVPTDPRIPERSGTEARSGGRSRSTSEQEFFRKRVPSGPTLVAGHAPPQTFCNEPRTQTQCLANAS